MRRPSRLTADFIMVAWTLTGVATVGSAQDDADRDAAANPVAPVRAHTVRWDFDTGG